MSTAKAFAYVAAEMQPDTAAPVATAIHTARQARRLQHLVNNLPTAVIVLDERGYVAEANPVAISMLGEPLVGQRWLDVIARSFRPRSDDLSLIHI